MATSEPSAFQALPERHYGAARDLKFDRFRVTEVDSSRGEPSPRVRRFTVQPEDLDPWLAGLTSSGSGTTKLRVILAKVGPPPKSYVPLWGGSRMPSPEALGEQEFTSGGSFPQQHIERIGRALSLPHVARLVKLRAFRPYRGVFEVSKTSSSSGDGPEPCSYGFSLALFTSLLVGFQISLSLSYTPSTGTTNAVLIGSTPSEALAWLEDDIHHLSHLAPHPFLLPVLVCQRLAEAIRATVDDAFDHLHRVEMRSGQTSILTADERGRPVPRGRCDDPDLPLEILGVPQLAAALAAYARAHRLTVASVRRELDAFPSLGLENEDGDEDGGSEEEGNGRRKRGRRGSKGEEKGGAAGDEEKGVMARQLNFVSQMLEFALIRIAHLKERAEVQTTAINNLLAQRNNEINRRLAESSTSIAHDTKRDSSAMKSIAILTMVFLPATFTATYFSTPGVTSTDPSQGTYWIVTIPLTLVVVVIWGSFYFLWVANRFNLTRTRTRDRKADDLVALTEMV
ncbi:hypothetical protein F4778DRAFT_759022 [Xylariomycetidae sp. FL2044]|nr:hypothetical protein F4778DRAFT_759022 [Xylariomycetidae sp. FL2044]